MSRAETDPHLVALRDRFGTYGLGVIGEPEDPDAPGIRVFAVRPDRLRDNALAPYAAALQPICGGFRRGVFTRRRFEALALPAVLEAFEQARREAAE